MPILENYKPASLADNQSKQLSWIRAAQFSQFWHIDKQLKSFYREQIENGDDLGSGFAVYHKGKLVVNLVGGYADIEAKRPWTLNTTSHSFSITKGVCAIVAALLVDR